jgi:hypothetical protein
VGDLHGLRPCRATRAARQQEIRSRTAADHDDGYGERNPPHGWRRQQSGFLGSRLAGFVIAHV